MKDAKLWFIILTIIIIYVFNSGFFNDMAQTHQQLSFMEKLEQYCDHPYFNPMVRYLITFLGAVAVQIFTLFNKNFNGSIVFLKQFFPDRSNTFYTRVNFCICTFIGSIIGFTFFNPQSCTEALASGFGWQGAMTVMMNRGRKASENGTDVDNDRNDDQKNKASQKDTEVDNNRDDDQVL